MTLIIFSDQFIAELSVTLFIKERLIVDINELSTIFEGYETQEPVKNIAASVAEKMYQTFSTSTKVLRGHIEQAISIFLALQTDDDQTESLEVTEIIESVEEDFQCAQNQNDAELPPTEPPSLKKYYCDAREAIHDYLCLQARADKAYETMKAECFYLENLMTNEPTNITIQLDDLQAIEQDLKQHLIPSSISSIIIKASIILNAKKHKITGLYNPSKKHKYLN